MAVEHETELVRLDLVTSMTGQSTLVVSPLEVSGRVPLGRREKKSQTKTTTSGPRIVQELYTSSMYGAPYDSSQASVSVSG